MKAISSTLVIIVTVIVVLIAALVVLTIFGSGVQPIVDMASARNLCLQQVAQSCTILGTVPQSWNVPLTVRKGNDVVQLPCSSAELAGCSNCESCGIIVPS